MDIYRNIKLWQLKRKEIKGDSVGIVMTMGAIHAGHVAIIKKCISENEITIVSLFLNPTQFDNRKDFNKYPMTWETDIELLRQAGVNYLFAPSKKEIYKDNYNYQIEERSLSNILCGKSRDGHFTGVLTVVMKLLMLTQPSSAYFGEKDYQQLTLIKEMIKAFFIPINIIGCEIVRDNNGVALSSRNTHLSTSGYKKAKKFANIIKRHECLESTKKQIEDENIMIDYLEEHNKRCFAAVIIDETRLIDNVKLK